MLVVGLGNPGSKYAGHRHNVGFMVVERLASRLGAPSAREKFSGLVTRARTAQGHDVVLLQPQTYMNLSGESVQKAMRFYKLELDEVIVVHDELDLGFEERRIKVGGGAAGHNGLKSIMQCCGGPDFVRVRVGIGRPKHGSPANYVLSDFSSEEKITLDAVVDAAADMVEKILELGPRGAMNAMHAKPKKKKKKAAKRKKPAAPPSESSESTESTESTES